jgi:predicted DCC family thiol-disulfide oxidoreductase YuxK
MISLASELTDRKGQHARGWLFYDAECDFCTRIARFLSRPMRRRRLGIAPLQDPRVGALLGLSVEELLHAVRFLAPDGSLHSGADAFLALAREMWWTRPLIWMCKIPGARAVIHAGYRYVARNRRCQAEQCEANQAAART